MKRVPLPSEAILDIVKKTADSNGSSIPEDIDDDFSTLFHGIDINNYLDISSKFCKRVKEILDNSDQTNNVYGEFVKENCNAIRLNIARELGADEIIEGEVGSTGMSCKEVLESFLAELKEGQSWSSTNIRKWESRLGNQKKTTNNGQKLYSKVSSTICWSEESVRYILKEKADQLLERNPYETKKREITCERDARIHLLKFLKTLPEGQTWNPKKLMEADRNTYLWMNKYATKGITSEYIEELLGEDAEVLLKKNPFERLKRTITSKTKAHNYLVELYMSQPEGKRVSVKTINSWTAQDGTRGHSIINFIKRNISGEITEESLRELLGKSADEVLRRNPFEKLNNPSLEKIKELLSEFFDRLPNGTPWSPQTLHSFRSEKTDSRINLCEWIYRNIKYQGKVDWLYVLVEMVPSSRLMTNPFYRYNADFLDNRNHKTVPRNKKKYEIDNHDGDNNNPEALMVKHEEYLEIQRRLSEMKFAINGLTTEDAHIVQSFMREQNIPVEKLGPALSRLKSIMETAA
ncbi:hypothetical protein JW758_02370 [Candidatus Peregrinibacteria bacterium]|nr:hypothetical protein [Candidatus Peregrinibacteria bacterium]